MSGQRRNAAEQKQVKYFPFLKQIFEKYLINIILQERFWFILTDHWIFWIITYVVLELLIWCTYILILSFFGHLIMAILAYAYFFLYTFFNFSMDKKLQTHCGAQVVVRHTIIYNIHVYCKNAVQVSSQLKTTGVVVQYWSFLDC